ncbi:MAG: tRNA (guanosine(37)-N1)-methyltransferase TrmD [Pseudomonadota bacterium]|nr:tRNA (guanosine(37)-N1)-methyltransferase TrmD [Pseudomonadota bacterium]
MTNNAIWSAKVLTLFPEMFPGILGLSLAGQGLKDGIWTMETINIRDFAKDKHKSVDDAPFGGGPGMVMRPDVISNALDHVKAINHEQPVIYLTPRGNPLKQARIKKLASGPGVTLLCGRFEGLDERVIEAHAIEQISLGDFVLSGGEIAAIAILDACVRLLNGIVGQPSSLIEESFEKGLLEYPHYTRPKVWKGRRVPDVLTSGNHENIRAWRKQQSEASTREKRPDLWARITNNII